MSDPQLYDEGVTATVDPVRLELTWPNKDRFLLSPKDETGKPVWVERDHPAAHEVRVADITNTHGNVPTDPRAGNLLMTGDSLDALRVLWATPEFARLYRGQVKLVYIDPPFNTGQTFDHYDDWMEHSTWLSFMRDRLLLIKDLLARDGTLWLHLDNFEVHRMRCLLDEIFGSTNHLGTVVWQRTSAKSLARKTMGTMHEQILVYGATDAAHLNTLYLPLEDAYLAKRYTGVDDRGRYDTGDLTATSYRPHLDSGKPWRGHDPSSRRRCWAVPTAPLVEAGFSEADLDALTMREKLDALDEHGYIHFPDKGGFPRFKKYAHKAKGRAIGDLWTDVGVINSQAVERTGFSTQKPEALLKRVIEMATEPGDIVLDCFGGSGTTAATAHKLGRRWVSVEVLPETMKDFIVPRLTKVVDGTDSGGITTSVGWAGGGGFAQVELAPSLYEVLPGGLVLMGDGIEETTFARAAAAQLGFTYEPSPPFSGNRNGMRLATFCGAVGIPEATHVLSHLEPGERVTLVAASVLSGVEEHVASTARGSLVLKAPRDVLTEATRRRTARTVASMTTRPAGEPLVPAAVATPEVPA
ncbi:site-specific DNA-methyltransferase [Nocardioides sp.]|uniref:site-specific DNA-methyltransferase n=1 Tax=Nocardioides sp. TaxID=35761 RepID=UPI002733D756|nr:site-specific DNA-methyltransferase [Nocardioides sp.]MDP3890497.1 site-specific DNA-methyltransferase [Nocardioides sp.]